MRARFDAVSRLAIPTISFIAVRTAPLSRWASHSLRRHPALAPLRRVWAYLRNDWAREGARMRRERPENLFQPYPYTSTNRYPRCFEFARDALGEAGALNLLSFGCASGQEAFTLSRYFPHARIKGVDINARAIAAARRATPPVDADRIRFDVASSAAAEPEGSYDAVFAFAVFRDDVLRDCPPRCDHVLRFADFDRAMSDLARCLKSGGLLFLRHAHFRFADSIAAKDFDVALTLEVDTNGARKPLYGPDDRLISTDSITADAAWRKRG
jgi:SAM-dependent methyltransferase